MRQNRPCGRFAWYPRTAGPSRHESAPHDSSQAPRPHRRDRRCRHGARGLLGRASTDPNTIEIGSLYEPVNLSNIAGGGQGVTEALNGNVYEGLFSLADDGTIQPQLATSYDVSEDGLTYTFHLRDGVTFSDGSSFDAADAVHSINRVLAEDSQSARKSQLAVINSVEATDPQTLTVTLSQRSISLPYNLSYLWMVPRGLRLADRDRRHRPLYAGRVDEGLDPRPQGPRRLLGRRPPRTTRSPSTTTRTPLR